MSLLAHNARLVRSGGVHPGGILVDDDGRIAAVLPPGDRPRADITIDAEERLLFPGFIDAHVHMRDPGAPHKESFASGTRSAAVGGITTVMCMPNTKPVLDTPAGFRAARKAAEGQAHVDFTLQGAIFPRNLDSASELWALGLTSFETLTAETAPDDTFGNPEEQRLLLDRMARIGATVGIYASDRSLIDAEIDRLKATGRTDFEAFAVARPVAAEAVTIAGLIELVRATGAATVLRQVSTVRGCALARTAKREGLTHLFVEATPHHLHLDRTALGRLGPFAQMLPPLRDPDDVRALVDGVVDGTVDFVGSDHAPHAVEEKTASDTPWKTPGGTPGLDTIVPAVLDLHARGLIEATRVADLLCWAPARIFGIAGRKGALEVGMDGDLVLVDMTARRVVSQDLVLSKAGRSPFEGHELSGWPLLTVLRGQPIAEAGALTDGQPGGRFVARDHQA
ncbi:MAG: dihydroorotase family protein [Azospirillaceae bacterium]